MAVAVNGPMTGFSTVPEPVGRLVQLVVLTIFALLSGGASVRFNAPERVQVGLLAQVGVPQAQYRLGELYEAEPREDAPVSTFIYWYRAAAESGHVAAQMKMAQIYHAGLGVERDFGQAIQWYERAGQRGSVEAQLMLGDIYFKGAGVAQDYAKAASWYGRAATQGSPEGEFALAPLYYRGQGVGKDTARAVSLYHAAAEAGHAGAQNVMGVLYAVGRAGLFRNPQEAARWWTLAARQGHEGARRNIERLQQAPNAPNAPNAPPATTPRPSQQFWEHPVQPPARPAPVAYIGQAQ